MTDWLVHLYKLIFAHPHTSYWIKTEKLCCIGGKRGTTASAPQSNQHLYLILMVFYIHSLQCGSCWVSEKWWFRVSEVYSTLSLNNWNLSQRRWILHNFIIIITVVWRVSSSSVAVTLPQSALPVRLQYVSDVAMNYVLQLTDRWSLQCYGCEPDGQWSIHVSQPSEHNTWVISKQTWRKFIFG